MQRQLEITKLQNQFGHFLVFTIAIFLISTMLFYLVAEDYVQDVYDPGFSWQTVLFLAVPCLLVIKVMKIPLADLGIKREDAWRSFRDTMGICLLLTIPAAIYLVWFKEPSAGQDIGVTVDPYFLVQYFAHSLFQEVGSRGLLQGLFQKFLDDKKGHRAIFLTSTVFASLHITFGIDAVVITFFASFIFGYLYLKQKNLVGVTILHYWLGVLAAFMVAFQGSWVMACCRELRLAHARDAIEREGKNVAEAAYGAGYSNPANFSTAFKRQYGLSLSEARPDHGPPASF